MCSTIEHTLFFTSIPYLIINLHNKQTGEHSLKEHSPVKSIYVVYYPKKPALPRNINITYPNTRPTTPITKPTLTISLCLIRPVA